MGVWLEQGEQGRKAWRGEWASACSGRGGPQLGSAGLFLGRCCDDSTACASCTPSVSLWSPSLLSERATTLHLVLLAATRKGWFPVPVGEWCWPSWQACGCLRLPAMRLPGLFPGPFIGALVIPFTDLLESGAWTFSLPRFLQGRGRKLPLSLPLALWKVSKLWGC